MLLEKIKGVQLEFLQGKFGSICEFFYAHVPAIGSLAACSPVLVKYAVHYNV